MDYSPSIGRFMGVIGMAYKDRGDPTIADFKAPRIDGATTTGTQTNHLIDANQFFIADGVFIGDWVHNTTDDTWAAVTVVNSENDLTLSADIMVSGESYDITDLRNDGEVSELSLSSIVPASGANHLVHISAHIETGPAGGLVSLRQKGNTSEWNSAKAIKQATEMEYIASDFWVMMDENRVIEYGVEDITSLVLVIRGWVVD